MRRCTGITCPPIDEKAKNVATNCPLTLIFKILLLDSNAHALILTISELLLCSRKINTVLSLVNSVNTASEQHYTHI